MLKQKFLDDVLHEVRSIRVNLETIAVELVRMNERSKIRRERSGLGGIRDDDSRKEKIDGFFGR